MSRSTSSRSTSPDGTSSSGDTSPSPSRHHANPDKLKPMPGHEWPTLPKPVLPKGSVHEAIQWDFDPVKRRERMQEELRRYTELKEIRRAEREANAEAMKLAEEMASREPPFVNQRPKLEELKDFEPKRMDLDEQWLLSEDDLNDGFFAQHFERLVFQISTVLEHHFQGGDRIVKASPWAFPSAVPEDTVLEEYAQAVVCPNNVFLHPWDDLIVESDQRALVLTAVFLRFLDDHVFSPLLFGADQDQTQTLEEQDGTFILDEGFARSRLRSDTINIFLSRTNGIPSRFWQTVDDRSLSLIALLIPILQYTREARLTVAPDLRLLYQDIHTQVTYAAWLAVMMRRSSSIVIINWPHHGELWRPHHDNVAPAVLERSRAAAEEFDRQPGPDFPLGDEGVARAARILISVVPSVRRYTLDAEANGQHEYVLMRPKVACFWGYLEDNRQLDMLVSRDDPERYLPSLPQYALRKRVPRRAPAGYEDIDQWLFPGVMACLLVAILYSSWREYGWGKLPVTDP